MQQIDKIENEFDEDEEEEVIEPDKPMNPLLKKLLIVAASVAAIAYGINEAHNNYLFDFDTLDGAKRKAVYISYALTYPNSEYKSMKELSSADVSIWAGGYTAFEAVEAIQIGDTAHIKVKATRTRLDRFEPAIISFKLKHNGIAFEPVER